MDQSPLTILQSIIRAEVHKEIRRKRIDLGHAKYELYLLDDERERIVMERGTVVKIYVCGLNIVGGTWSLESKDFWRMIVRTIRDVKKMWEPNMLIHSSLALIHTEGRRMRAKINDDASELVGILPESEIKEVSWIHTVTYKDTVTGDKVTFSCSKNDSRDLKREARVALWSKRKREVFEEEGESGDVPARARETSAMDNSKLYELVDGPPISHTDTKPSNITVVKEVLPWDGIEALVEDELNWEDVDKEVEELLEQSQPPEELEDDQQ